MRKTLKTVDTQPKASRRLPLLAMILPLLFAFVLSPAAAKKKVLENIPLEWKPTTELGELGVIDLSGLYDTQVEIGEFKDSRENPSLIAENREDEDEGKILRVTTSDSVADWAAKQLGETLELFGIDTVDSEEGPGTVVIQGEVKKFFVVEGHVYESDVALLLTVKDRSGKTLWRGLAGGSATRFGRSYKAENYYEVLSDAFLEAVHRALETEAFRIALQGKTP